MDSVRLEPTEDQFKALQRRGESDFLCRGVSLRRFNSIFVTRRHHSMHMHYFTLMTSYPDSLLVATRATLVRYPKANFN